MIFRKITKEDIKCDVELWIQTEAWDQDEFPHPQFDLVQWGAIETKDIPRLNRELGNGTNIWWVLEINV